MKLHILIGGKAGQGINKISEIVSRILIKQGYFTFNYRDYPSLIRGGHNFNILSVSDKKIGSSASLLDGIIAMDERTIPIHESELKKNAFKISFDKFQELGRNLNVAQAGALIKILGIPKQELIQEIKEQLNFPDSIKAAEIGYDSEKEKFKLGKLNNKIKIMNGNIGVSEGAINSGINLYIGYPMTPATGVLNELAGKQLENKNEQFMVFQEENEIAVANSALGASFTGAKVMIGSSGGGFDLMTEALSFQGQSEIPLVVYLAARPGPGTGVPTYTTQGDLDIALRAGHGEFPRVVIAPGDPIECIEKTNEAFYLSEKFNTLAIILSDKHLAESEFSTDRKANKVLKIEIKRKIPGETIVKASSYEHDKFGNTIEDAKITKANAEARIEKYKKIKQEAEKFQMIKIFGKQNSKNLIIGWGSTKTAILDAIGVDSDEKDLLDAKFLQVLYLKPMSNKIKEEMQKAKNIILVENNLTGQLGRLLREKTGISIPTENRILRYDARPFLSDELRKEIERRLK